MPGQPAPGSNPIITFDVFDQIVQEPGLPSTVIIEQNKNWQVKARFKFDGLFANWIVGLPVKWEFSVKAESMGPGPERNFGPVTGTTNAGQREYGPGKPGPVPTVNISAGELPPGAYKLVCTVTFKGSPPMAGYHEGPIIQIIP